jgi:SprT protein
MERIIAKIKELTAIAEAKWPGYNFDVKVSMNDRLRTTAGRAWFAEGKVEFASKIYENNVEQFLEDTVPHEFAHIVANRVYGSTGHDNYWKQVVAALGSSSTRCHSYEVKSTKAKTYKYRCSCMIHEITPQRRSWMLRGKVYKCSRCGDFLIEV